MLIGSKPKTHPDHNWKPRTEPQWFAMIEPWVIRTNKLFRYWQDEKNDATKRQKAQSLYEAMNARVIIIFGNIIQARIKLAQARRKIISGDSATNQGRTLLNNQKSKLFHRRFKK